MRKKIIFGIFFTIIFFSLTIFIYFGIYEDTDVIERERKLELIEKKNIEI